MGTRYPLLLMTLFSSFGCAGIQRGQPLDVPASALASLEVRRFDFGAVHDDDGRSIPLDWPGAFQGGALVSSYPDPSRFVGGDGSLNTLASRSFLYDDALLALSLIQGGDREGAAQVLAALAALQLPDGAWGFSVDLESGFYDAGFVRSGTVAFLVYAFARYALRFGGGEAQWVRRSALHGGNWLLEQRREDTGLIGAGRGIWSEGGARLIAKDPVDFVATEHQIDAFFSFAALASMDPGGPWSEAAASLAAAVDSHLWIEEEGRFAQGLQAGALDRQSALDASGGWGALFLLARGEEERARRALAWVEEVHRIDGAGFRPYGDGPALTFVEASIGVALAWHRLGPSSQKRARAALASIESLGQRFGWPLIYSTIWAKDFPKSPAAGPTLWYLLVEEEIASGGEAFLWSETLDPT